jgi:hypothetical protein
MERRTFLLSLLGVAGAAAVTAVSGIEAQAMPVSPVAGGQNAQPHPEEAVATPEDVAQAKTETVQYWRRRRFVRRYYYRPRYRRRYFVRRRFYRRRWW